MSCVASYRDFGSEDGGLYGEYLRTIQGIVRVVDGYVASGRGSCLGDGAGAGGDGVVVPWFGTLAVAGSLSPECGDLVAKFSRVSGVCGIDGVGLAPRGAENVEEATRGGLAAGNSGGSATAGVCGGTAVCVDGGVSSGRVASAGGRVEHGYAETVVTGVSASYRRNRRKREQKKRQKERVVSEVQAAPVGVRDVATPQQMRELAVQRAELYRLENERKIIKARREIAMEKQVEASGAQVQRVDNWIADVKNGSSRSSGSGWASHKTKSSKNSVWSKSWRSQSSAGTSGESVVSEEVHNAVLKRVTELERELAETKAISASRAAEARSNGLRADVVEREVFSLKVANKVAEVVTPEARVTNKAAEFRATKGANPFNILTPDDTDWRSDEVGKLLDAVAVGQDEYSGLPYSGGGTPYYN